MRYGTEESLLEFVKSIQFDWQSRLHRDFMSIIMMTISSHLLMI